MNIQAEQEQQHVSMMAEGIPLSTLQVRLDTEPIIRQLRKYLSGSEYITSENADGLLQTKKVMTGKPLANDEGVNAIINSVQMLVNPSIGQGNIKDFNEYKAIKKLFRERLAEELSLNITNWGIKEENYAGIMNTISLSVMLFLSRLVGNKERESYTNTLQSVETTRSQEGQPGKRFGLFGSRRNR